MAVPALSTYGWGAAAELKKRQAARAAAAAAAAVPTSAQIAQEIASLYAQGPDYAGYGVNLDPYAAADERARAAGFPDAKAWADAQMKDQTQGYEDWYKTATAHLGEQRKLSQDAATNFNKAFAGILTGGLEGQAGRDYALKTFGGSYLGEIATVEGQRMFTDITRDFAEKDFELLDKIMQIRAKYPEIRDQIYRDVVNTEIENSKNGISLADSDFDHRIKAASVLLDVAQNTEKLQANDTKNARDNLTKITIAKIKAAKGGSTANLQLRKVGNEWVIFNPEDGSTTSTGVVEADTPRTQQATVNGRRVVVDMNTGQIVQDLGPAGTPDKGGGSKDVKFTSTRAKAMSLADSLWKQKQRPTVIQAYQSVMSGYGQLLLGAGYKPQTVHQMIRNILKAVSGGAWVVKPLKKDWDAWMSHAVMPPPGGVGGGTAGVGSGAPTETK